MTTAGTIRLDLAEGSPFGPNNLPYGVYRAGDAEPRCATRLGDVVVDLAVLLDDEVFAAPSLNTFMAQGHARWVQVRAAIGAALRDDVPAEAVHAVDDVSMLMPFEVADYVDFYASEHHASNLGRLFRPDSPDPLMPNWKHLPVGYHGRAGTVVVSGTDVVRPCGQRKGPDRSGAGLRAVGAARHRGRARRSSSAPEALWESRSRSRTPRSTSSASCCSTTGRPATSRPGSTSRSARTWASRSPPPCRRGSFRCWRCRTPRSSPRGRTRRRCPTWRSTSPWGLDVELEVAWNGEVVSRPPYREMYWSPAQMLAHMTVNGASARTGDLFASGTVSGAAKETRGAFIELTWGGTEPVSVGGEERTFLEDGDEVVITGSAPGRGGSRIGFGECRGRVVPARG